MRKREREREREREIERDELNRRCRKTDENIAHKRIYHGTNEE